MKLKRKKLTSFLLVFTEQTVDLCYAKYIIISSNSTLILLSIFSKIVHFRAKVNCENSIEQQNYSIYSLYTFLFSSFSSVMGILHLSEAGSVNTLAFKRILSI